MAQITESELILPTLYILSKEKGNFISTSDLILKLTEIMHPTGIDAEILKNRNDTHFSQKVRNLKSHDTLTRKDFATYENNGYVLSETGRLYLEQNLDSINYLLNNTFDYEDIKTELDKIEQQSYKQRKRIHLVELVSEGVEQRTSSIAYKRSSNLRNYAKDYYTKNGKLFCDCCNFDFSTSYATPYNKNCIEMHHIKPIFQYEDDDENKTIEEDLKNILPVCPNCHRVIHRNKIYGMEGIQIFKASFKNKGIYTINPQYGVLHVAENSEYK